MVEVYPTCLLQVKFLMIDVVTFAMLIGTCDVMTTMKRPNIKRNITTSREVTELLTHFRQPIFTSSLLHTKFKVFLRRAGWRIWWVS